MPACSTSSQRLFGATTGASDASPHPAAEPPGVRCPEAPWARGGGSLPLRTFFKNHENDPRLGLANPKFVWASMFGCEWHNAFTITILVLTFTKSARSSYIFSKSHCFLGFLRAKRWAVELLVSWNTSLCLLLSAIFLTAQSRKIAASRDFLRAHTTPQKASRHFWK